MTSIDSLLHEERHFPPTPEFIAKAVAKPALYEAAKADRLAFWADQSRALVHWHEPFTQTLDWTDAPFAKWFADGRINVAYNCLDRHVEAGNGDRVAFHWEGEPGDSRTITYAELTAEVKRAANALASLGVVQGDRIAIYLPMIPEAVVAMLAVARLGAIHSVVFGGFSADSLRARIEDAEAKLVITADGGWRKGKVFPLKDTVDTAVEGATTIEHVLVVKRGENEVTWNDDRDVWWHDAMRDAAPEHEAQPFDAENPLFILYTSGTTGKPKGILHTSGGYLTQVAFTHKNVFDLHPETDVYWCSADVGWITGHSYVVYGPLANGATSVIYEGTPDTPHPGRWWELIQKYRVSIFYTAPTAIRSFMKVGRQVPDGFDLSSIRVLGSVGEPINPEAWIWYRDVIGGGKAPIVDTWWQ
ncbi:MAG TPA: AMP-binding protein, partial [Pseudolysinimonas sp.]